MFTDEKIHYYQDFLSKKPCYQDTLLSYAPAKLENDPALKMCWIETLLGPMMAIGNEEALILLEFIERRGLKRELELLKQKTGSVVVPGVTQPLQMIKEELNFYFKGELKVFRTPIILQGTSFQKGVWEQLQKIPYGETRSYAEVACGIGRATACRAVAQANGSNQLAIIVPCHRVINSNGQLGGYAGGLSRKQWLLDHEKRMNQS